MIYCSTHHNTYPNIILAHLLKNVLLVGPCSVLSSGLQPPVPAGVLGEPCNVLDIFKDSALLTLILTIISNYDNKVHHF